MATGWAALDEVLPDGGLRCGNVHEWLGTAPGDDDQGSASPNNQGGGIWLPPLAVLTHLAARAATAVATSAGQLRHTIWVGTAVWPYAHGLTVELGNRDNGGNPISHRLLDRSLFVRASEASCRLWAVDLALRSPAVAAVIADGSGFDLAATRRLQLAAEAGGSVCLLARPPRERSSLSAAATRWLVRTCPSSDLFANGVEQPGFSGAAALGRVRPKAEIPLQVHRHTPARRWTLELLRCKGMRPVPGAQRPWTLEHDHATRTLAVVPGVLDRPDSAAVAAAQLQRASARRSAG